MALIALMLVGTGVVGWLVADALRENHLRYRAEEERWHDAFERILAAQLPPGSVAEPQPEELPREWRLLAAPPAEHRQHRDAGVTTRLPAGRLRPVRRPFQPPV